MAKKKQAKKTTTGRGSTYCLTASGAKALVDVKGQGAVIRDCVAKNGPITAEGVLSRVGKAMNSDSAKKNIAFYLSQWKKEGWLKTGPKLLQGGKKAA